MTPRSCIRASAARAMRLAGAILLLPCLIQCRELKSDSVAVQSDSGISAAGSGTSGGGGTSGAAPPGAPNAGGGGTSGAGPVDAPSCTTEGALRCAGGGSGERETCAGGRWATTAPCGAGEVCDSGNTDAPGSCASAAEFCLGSAGVRVCAGAVMHECSDDALSVSQQTCASERHCQLGLASGACATCIPGENYRCEDTQLMVCDADGSGFELAETCATAALCNAEAGACTSDACVAGGFTCTQDMLRRCNADRTAFEDVMQCAPGMCDATAGECDLCTPAARSCVAGAPVTCNAQGQAYDDDSCTAPRSLCTGLGACVECVSNADCSATPATCHRIDCNVATGSCQPRLVPGMDCQRTDGQPGVCTDQGACVACVDSADCSNSSAPRCDISTHLCVQCLGDTDCSGTTAPYCDTATNRCVACRDAGDCSTSQQCRVPTCNANQCGTSISQGATCPGGVCNAAGACVGCLSDAHCSTAGARRCNTSTNECVECTANSHCTASAEPYCNVTSNQCVRCTASSQCPTNFGCRDDACVWIERCGNGFTEGTEQCDDGNAIDTDLCDSQCRITVYRPCTDVSECAGGFCAAISATQPFTCSPPCSATGTCTNIPGTSFEGICIQISCFIECRPDRTCPHGYSCVGFLSGSQQYSICAAES